MSVIHNDLLLATDEATGYNLTKSVRLRASASAYLSRTPASAGNRRTFTWSGWVKLGLIDANYHSFFANGNAVDSMVFWNDNTLALTNLNGTSYLVRTTQVFRDPSAWYHLVIAFDTTQATASNRIKIYVNGVQVTSFVASTYPSQNYDTGYNTTTAQYIAYNEYNRFDGYMAEVNFIDGQQLTPSSFGENNADTGVWQPIRYTGTYGTNGFYLPFTDVATTSGSNAGLGKDFSGNGNYWTTNNISVTSGSTYDSMTDVPTLTSATAANYAVINANNTNGTPSNANLKFTGASAAHSIAASSIAFNATENKYCEVYIDSTNVITNGIALGLVDATKDCNVNGTKLSAFTGGYGWQNYLSNGGFNFGASASYSLYNAGAVYTNGDVLGIHLNNGTLTFYKNGTSQGTAASGITGQYCFAGSAYDTDSFSFNFGQRPFAYTPPTGATALNTYNLPDSTIVAGNAHFDTKLWTGNSSTQTISGLNFQPSMLWVKDRSAAQWNNITDAVRGVGKEIFTNATNAEETNGAISSFNSDGFSLINWDGANKTGDSYVGWAWKGNGAGSSNTAGSITSSVSVNTSAGFSVVTYTGSASNPSTVGHGLGVAPSMIIIKDRSSAYNWCVYHTSVGNTKSLYLNTNGASATDIGYWNNTSPTSSVFTVNYDYAIAKPSDNYVAYCWSEVLGFSKFGSYTGNNSTDGPFIYLGFKPKFILFKPIVSGSWVIFDSARDAYNIVGNVLIPNTSAAETSYPEIDFLSNGFKIKQNAVNSYINDSGVTYIYAAFAENPFKNSLAR